MSCRTWMAVAMTRRPKQVVRHFWMANMPARKRGSGNQDIRKRSAKYKEAVRRKIGVYHRFVQLGCIAQGLGQRLDLPHAKRQRTRLH